MEPCQTEPHHLRPDDLVILVMGVTGVGKSTLISKLTDQPIDIGDDLISCTQTSKIYNFDLPTSQRVYLVDTPGFDDTYRSDMEILLDISFLLTRTYTANITFAGVIYLHNIQELKMGGTSKKQLRLFKEICGEAAYRHIVLATSMWGNLAPEAYTEAEQRSKLLKMSEEAWGSMCRRGGKVMKWDGDKDSALAIVKHLIQVQKGFGKVVFKIQREIVDEKKTLLETSAGGQMSINLAESQHDIREELQGLRADEWQATQEQNEQLVKELLEERRELEWKLEQSAEAQRRLKEEFQLLAAEKEAEHAKVLEEYEKKLAELSKSQLGSAEEAKSSKRKWLVAIIPLISMLAGVTSAVLDIIGMAG